MVAGLEEDSCVSVCVCYCRASLKRRTAELREKMERKEWCVSGVLPGTLFLFHAFDDSDVRLGISQ